VALAGALRLRTDDRTPVVCLATAHPAKFPDVIVSALELAEGSPLPEAVVHPDLVRVPDNEANLSICALDNLEDYLADAIGSVESSAIATTK
jgi:threonine synthase